jgi:hypothetical protein
MKKLTIEEMKKVGAIGWMSFDGCSGKVCCISFEANVPSGKIQVCGTLDWYMDY